MKQIFTIISFIFLNNIANAQIPNAGFELLDSNGSLMNWQYGGTLLVTIGDSIITDGPSISVSTNAHSGSYAMELRNSYNYTQNSPYFYGNATCTLPDSLLYIGFTKKFPITFVPKTFDFYYRITQNPYADSTTGLTNIYNAAGNLIGEASTTFWDIDNTYKPKSIEIIYHTSSANYLADSIPAFAEITFFNIANTSLTNVGQRTLIDDVSFNNSTLSNSSIENRVGIKAFPNPSSNKLNLLFSEEIQNSTITIIDKLGKIVLTKEFKKGKFAQIDIAELSAGVYFIKTNCNRNCGTIKFIKL